MIARANAEPLGTLPAGHAYTGVIIAKPRAELDDATRKQALALIAPHLSRTIAETDEHLLTVPPGLDDRAFAATLVATKLFAYAHPDYLLAPASDPNDPQYSFQWHLSRIDASRAWDIRTDASAITIAIVDSGVQLSHPEFTGRWVPGANCATGICTPQSSGGDVLGITDHGTKVAGIASAATDNAQGVSGIAWNARLMPVRVSNNANGSATASAIAAGVRFAADNGAKVINASFEGADLATIQTAGAYAKARGALLVYAAGNQGRTLDPNAPQPDVIIVSGTTQTDSAFDSTNVGVSVKLAAPSQDILTTTFGSGYASVEGTSFGTPQVAGALALMFAQAPSASAQQIQDALLASCNDLGDPGRDDTFGQGRLNLRRALLAASNLQGPPIAIAHTFRLPSPASVADLDVLAHSFDPLGQSITLALPSTLSPAGAALAIITGPGNRPLVRYTPVPGFTGIDALTVRLNSASGQFTLATFSVDCTPLAQYIPASFITNPAPGLIADYYQLSSPSALPNFSALTPYRRSVEPELNFPTSSAPFASSARTTDVGAAFTSYFLAPTTGQYTFALLADDGSRLLINEVELLPADGPHLALERSASIRVRAGEHKVRVEYFQASGPSTLIVRVTDDAGYRRVIEREWLWSRSRADIASIGGTIGSDAQLTIDDIIAFLFAFFADDTTLADIAAVGGGPSPDGQVTPDDLISFIQAFFAGPP